MELLGENIYLFKERSQVYTGNLPGGGFLRRDFLRGVIYIPCLNCYFIVDDFCLYRKDIKNKPAYLFMRLRSWERSDNSLKYSNEHHRLIFNKDSINISALNPRKRKIDVEFEKIVGIEILDFKLFGRNATRVVSVTKDNYIFLHNLSEAQKRGVVASYKVEPIHGREKQCTSVAVCDKSDYVFIEIGGEYKDSLSAQEC